MNPEVDQTFGWEERLNKVVEEMKALNISSISINQDTVVVGAGGLEYTPEELAKIDAEVDNLGCPPGCTSPFCSCPGTD